MQTHRDVFQFLRSVRRLRIVALRHLHAGERLGEANQQNAVAEVRCKVVDLQAGSSQMLVGPATERVLLYVLPLRVGCEIIAASR